MRLIVCVAILLAFATQAWAFDPEPGHRAAPIVGNDMISGEVISLEEHHGKWVLLCFWTSW